MNRKKKINDLFKGGFRNDKKSCLIDLKPLEDKCEELGIELRIVDRWYPSSKLCHECGCIKKDLKLSDREYICECEEYDIEKEFLIDIDGVKIKGFIDFYYKNK